jgi:hypothetical protein
MITDAASLEKSRIACTFGRKVCRENISARRARVPRFFVDLAVGLSRRRSTARSPAHPATERRNARRTK